MEFLKKDLQEFTNVMKEDTTKAAVDVKKQLTVRRIVSVCFYALFSIFLKEVIQFFSNNL